MPKLDVGGMGVHVQRAGDHGPDLILIHGVTGDLSVWYLCKAMAGLAVDHRVTAYDLRGHGYTDVPPAGYTSADHAADLLALMDVIGAKTARLVGHSFGGVIAAHAAAIAPERVEAIVLSDPYFPALRHLEDLSRWGHWETFRGEAEEAGVTLQVEHWYDLDRFFDQVVHLDAEHLLKFRQAVGLPAMNRLMKLGRTTCGPDTKAIAGLTTELIHGITAPVLAIYGEASPFRATSSYLAEHLADCREVIIPGAKHRAPEENPEAFLAAVRDFLASLPDPGVGR